MKNLVRSLLLATASLLAVSAAGADQPLNVVASFSIIGDFAKQVGGDRIALTTIVGPDGDAHAYEAKPQDAAALSKADVILANGAHFEGFLPRLLESSGAKAPVTELTKGVDLLKSPEEHEGEHDHDEAKHDHDDDGHDEAHEGHDHGPLDPHAFQSAANAKIYVANIADAFCAADAAGCETYKANAERYAGELTALDADLKQQAAAVPEARRTVISSHDAFRYFEAAYGIRFLAAEGITTEAEPSAAGIAKLIDQAREGKASAIFVENITDPRLAEQIGRETGLAMGGTLYSDALTASDGAAPTYIEMMRQNMRTITGAIGGS